MNILEADVQHLTRHVPYVSKRGILQEHVKSREEIREEHQDQATLENLQIFLEGWTDSYHNEDKLEVRE